METRKPGPQMKAIKNVSARMKHRCRGVYNELGTQNHVQTVLRLGLLYVLFNPPEDSVAVFVSLSLAGLGLLSSSARNVSVLWLAIGAMFYSEICLASDNHDYLFVYWCGLMALVLTGPNKWSEQMVRLHSSILLGLAFSFAVLWKMLLSADYFDGRFFYGTFLFDSRFYHFASAVSLDGGSSITNARVMLRELMNGAMPGNSMVLPVDPSLWNLSIFSTWWTAVVESAIAVCFLFARCSERFRNLRSDLLLYFVWCTYAMAPVAGFGWLVLILGFGQLSDDQKLRRFLYMLSFVLILGYRLLPVSELVRDVSL